MRFWFIEHRATGILIFWLLVWLVVLKVGFL